ncbi:MAG: gamma-glutamyl-gamma-aminobutyrate hydrolase family protein [Candidatus Actinomarinaceae bacterium]
MSEDGLVEGIESTSEWEALGIQWHPENLLEDEITYDLMNWLVE